MGEQVIKGDSSHGVIEHPADKLSRCLQKLVEGTSVPCEFILPSRAVLHFGNGSPSFRVTFHNPAQQNRILDDYSFCRGYIKREIDIEGDFPRLLDLRFRLQKSRLAEWILFWKSLLSWNPMRSNRKIIESHYGHGTEFYLTFLDSRYHLYSHALFPSDSASLEQASENKMRYAYESLRLEPGQHLLDIGAGWGGIVDYAGSRGVRVTALTLSKDSHDYIHNLIQKKNLPCEVHLEDFLVHQPEKPYDAIINFGVIEHIPQYQLFFQKVWDCLKPGGRFYLDGSATKEKYDKSLFIAQYIWPGVHTFMCLQNLIQELLFHGMDLLEVRNESHDYERTMWHWARNLDAHKDRVVERWGEEFYRGFRIFLWGGYHSFLRDELQAYHVLARRGPGKGQRPGLGRRVLNFLKELT
ncbi:MAG: class I SAM-dependent methyltransferase [Nitrospinaceae bacterium]